MRILVLIFSWTKYSGGVWILMRWSVQRAIRWSDQFSLTPANTLVWYGMAPANTPLYQDPWLEFNLNSFSHLDFSVIWLFIKAIRNLTLVLFSSHLLLCFLPSGFDRLNLNPLLQRCICCIPIEKDPNHWKCILPRFTASHFSLSLLFKINLSLKGSL